MAWSPRESDLIDEILLAAGKALYLANRFELKCKRVLHVAHLADIIRDDPVVALEQAVAQLPGEKKLYDTLAELIARSDTGVSQERAATLHKARKARNDIAHESAGAIGDLWSYEVRSKIDALRNLRPKVTDLASGDAIVSAWVARIESPGGDPFTLAPDYSEQAVNWVFAHVPSEWLDPAWTPDHRSPRTIREAVSYVPWYSRP